MAHSRYGLTTVLVSHHLPEVLRLADEVIRLENGRISGQGHPALLFPESPGIPGGHPDGSSQTGVLDLTGEIISIRHGNDQHTVTIRIGEKLTELSVCAGEAVNWHVGQLLTLSIGPKIS